MSDAAEEADIYVSARQGKQTEHEQSALMAGLMYFSLALLGRH